MRTMVMIRFVLSLLVAPLVAVGAGTAALAADPPADQATSQPAPPVAVPSAESFLASVAADDQFEIESSKLALERSRSRAVKDFADRMVDDHRAAAIRLKEALARAKREMPPEKLDVRQQAILDDLKARDAQSFDKAYIEAQYRAHLATADLFRTYATAGDDARIKQFAQELLLMVRAHLDQASRLRGADKAS